MITRFEVDGFKSLRNFAVDLEPLTVFVGPNGAGKSNLLEAIALLGRLASMPVEEAFKKGRGRVLDQFSRFAGETSRAIRFGVEVSLPAAIADAEGNPLPTDYRYELVIERRVRDSGIEELAVTEENLRVKREGESANEGDLILSQQRVLKRKRQVFVSTPREYPGETEKEENRVPFTHTSLAAFREGLEEPVWFVDLSREEISRIDELAREMGLSRKKALTQILAVGAKVFAQKYATTETPAHFLLPNPRKQLTDELAQFSLIHLDAARLREPTEKISSGILAPDASNLAAVLADLPAPILGAIRADIVSLIPGLSGFDIVADGDSLRIDFKLSGGEVLPARLASDGTLRALALLAVLAVEPHPSMIAIEEPENGIYPGRLRRLLTILRELALTDKKTQILLTTHSPVVIATFRDKPELLRVVDIVLRDGKRDTRARRVGKPNKQSEAAAVASLREVDALLHAADVEAAE